MNYILSEEELLDLIKANPEYQKAINNKRKIREMHHKNRTETATTVMMEETSQRYFERNLLNQFTPVDGSTSDGHHTFDELYEHRCMLFCALIAECVRNNKWFRDHYFWSRLHHDGTMYEDYIIAGIHTHEGYITYHMHEKYIEQLPACIEVSHAPEWDGHTSQDVLNRLRNYFKP